MAEPVVTASRRTEVGSTPVLRALPTRGRRTVGAWCFVDHFGPAEVTAERGMDVGPHPHMGLQTVTWLLAGEVLHRDSLGSEQLIRPGQLNLMTAGHGVSHAEEARGHYEGELHGLQLWVAQPAETRQAEAAFEHHAELPVVELESGQATVLVGDLAGAASPARRDTDHVGVDLVLGRGRSHLPLDKTFEYALVATSGSLSAGGATVEPGHLVYLGTGRDELALDCEAGARALLIGGRPFPEPVLMWWNFVARTKEEVVAGYEDWTADSGRFGTVESPLRRIETARPMWSR